MPEQTSYQIQADEHRVIELTESGDYVVELVGAGAEVEIFARKNLAESEQFQISVVIKHTAGRTRATTKLLGVANDSAYLKIAGKIIIEADCKDCESFLTERVLLLSPKAHAEVIPDLEIKNNAVRCSHAASISYIPAEQVFYLMSRGLTEVEAKAVIAEAFLRQ